MTDHHKITAGTMEVIMAITLRLRWMSSPRVFAEKYGIDEASLMEACDGDETLLQNLRLAHDDEMNPEYLTKEGKLDIHILFVIT